MRVFATFDNPHPSSGVSKRPLMSALTAVSGFALSPKDETDFPFHLVSKVIIDLKFCTANEYTDH